MTSHDNAPKKPKSSNRSDRGAVMVAVAVLLPVMLGFTALAVDIGFLYIVQAKLQTTADATALAGASQLTTQLNQVPVVAAEYAERNHPSGAGEVVKETDIEIGDWDFATRTFSDTNLLNNAVRVTAWMAQSNNNPVHLLFARVLGFDEADVGASSVAVLASVSRVDGVPLGLRAPGFGPVDPTIGVKNPGKLGPTEGPFSIGQHVRVAAYGHGRQGGVSLVLDLEEAGLDVHVQKILEGEDPPVPLEVGDEFLLENHGATGEGTKVDERLDLPWDDPARTIIMPVLEVLPGSRNDEGEIIGRIKIVEYVAVHLEGIEEVQVEDLEGKIQESEHVFGTVVRITVSPEGVRAPTSPVPTPSVTALKLVQ